MESHLIVKSNIFRKKLKILVFNETDGVIIISDKKMKYFSILSRNPTMNHDVVEFYLSKIDYLKLKCFLKPIVDFTSYASENQLFFLNP